MMNHYWSIPGEEVLHESTSAHGANSEPNSLVKLDPGLYVWTIVTFILVFFTLSKFAWKPLLELLDKRQASIDQSLEAAQKAREELENVNKESESILNEARTEAQSIMSDAKATAEKMKDDIVDKANENAQTQLEKAKDQIIAEKDKALTEVRQKVVDMSLAVAEKIIKKNISTEDNESIINDSIEKIDNYEA